MGLDWIMERKKMEYVEKTCSFKKLYEKKSSMNFQQDKYKENII